MKNLHFNLVLTICFGIRIALAQDILFDQVPQRNLSTKKCKRIPKIKSTKAPTIKSTKAPTVKSTKSPLLCSCPCCDEPTCDAFMNEEESVNGQDGFCLVSAFEAMMPPVRALVGDGRDLSAVCDAEEPCKYDSDGELDDAGEDCYADCCNNLGIGHYGCTRRRHLNEISASNKRKITEHEDGISVSVTAGHPSGLDWAKGHVEEMKSRMEDGEVARAWDPLFNAYFKHTKDIDMACDHADGESLSCKYTGASQCAIDLIKAHTGYHAEIAASIRENGNHEIDAEHAIPESCK